MDSPIQAGEAALDPRAEMRARMVDLQQNLVTEMVASGFSSGVGALLAGINAPLDALDKAPVEAEAGERAIVADDNRTIMLTIYREEEALAAIALDPARAVGLSGKLAAAAHRRLSRTESCVV